MLRSLSHGLSVVAVAVLLLAASDARAEEAITFEPRASLIAPRNMIATQDSVYPGAALAVNGAISLDLEPIIVEPELSLVGDGFPSLKGGTFRAMAGIRAGVAGPVEPAIFLHVGYGFIGISWASPVITHAFSLDTGFALDYRLSRTFAIGGSIGYDLLANGKGAIHGAFIGPRFSIGIN